MPITVVIRVKLPAADGKAASAADFWSSVTGTNPTAQQVAELEAKVKQQFPEALRERVVRRLVDPSSANSSETIKRPPDSDGGLARPLGRLIFTVERITYGTMNIEMAVKHAGELISAFGISPDDLISILAFQVPGALNQVLATNHTWESAINYTSAVTTLDDYSPPGNQPPPNAGGAGEARFWKLVGAAWVLPFLVTIVVAVLMLKEVNEKTHSFDTEIMNVKNAEVTRLGARLTTLDKYAADILVRYENIVNQYAVLVGKLADEKSKDPEISRLSQRVAALDKQIAELASKQDSAVKPPPPPAGRTSAKRRKGRR